MSGRGGRRNARSARSIRARPGGVVFPLHFPAANPFAPPPRRPEDNAPVNGFGARARVILTQPAIRIHGKNLWRVYAAADRY